MKLSANTHVITHTVAANRAPSPSLGCRSRALGLSGDRNGAQIVGEIREPALDLIDPARVGRCVVRVEAGMGIQPTADRRALVGAVVVADQVHVELVGDEAVDLLKELLDSIARWRRRRLLIIVPSSVLNAANWLVVPWRR